MPSLHFWGWRAALSGFLASMATNPRRSRCRRHPHSAITVPEARLELIVEQKVRGKQLTDDGNVKIAGRDEQRPGASSNALSAVAGTN